MKKQSAAKGKTEAKQQTTIKNNKTMKTEKAKPEITTAETVSQKDKFILVSPSVLVPNPKNPRIKYEEIKELMKSLLENGFLVPLTGYYVGDKIHLKDGHRRMKAIEMAAENGHNIARVPVIIVPKPTEEQETLDYIIYNDGKPLNMLEQSEVIKRLLNYGWKITDIEKKTGKARGYIENLIILTKLPVKVYNYIVEDKISAHAVITIVAALKGIENADLLAEVEGAIKEAEKAGKSKATPKHVKTAKAKGKTYGAFYKWMEEIVDFLAGRKDLHTEKALVISTMMVAFENGQRPKEVAERYFLDKTKKDAGPTKTETKKEQPQTSAKKEAPKKGAAKVAPVKKTTKKK